MWVSLATSLNYTEPKISRCAGGKSVCGHVFLVNGFSERFVCSVCRYHYCEPKTGRCGGPPFLTSTGIMVYEKAALAWLSTELWLYYQLYSFFMVDQGSHLLKKKSVRAHEITVIFFGLLGSLQITMVIASNFALLISIEIYAPWFIGVHAAKSSFAATLVFRDTVCNTSKWTCA